MNNGPPPDNVRYLRPNVPPPAPPKIVDCFTVKMEVTPASNWAGTLRVPMIPSLGVDATAVDNSDLDELSDKLDIWDLCLQVQLQCDSVLGNKHAVDGVKQRLSNILRYMQTHGRQA